MDAAHRDRVSEAEYLERERRAADKHEYINGEMIAMAGGSFHHALIATNIASALGRRLASGPCIVVGSDLRVNVSATQLYTYPDVTVICGKPVMHPSDDGTIQNPTILIEVLLESTEAYDRGAKFAHYQKLSTLREYLLVRQDERGVERFERASGSSEGSWLYTKFAGDEVVALPAAGVELPLGEVYFKVDLPG